MSSCDLGSAAVATKPRSVSQIVGDLRIHWDGSGGDLGMQCTGVKRCVPTADGSESGYPPVEVKVVYPMIYPLVFIPGGFLAAFLKHQQYVLLNLAVSRYMHGYAYPW